jgi:triphosphoribosyl-dephospho-CoA synthetase
LSQLFFNSAHFFFSSLPAVYRYTQDAVFSKYYYGVFPYITPWVYAFGLIAQTGSIYCTLGVTVERYIVICWPLR